MVTDACPSPCHIPQLPPLYTSHQQHTDQTSSSQSTIDSSTKEQLAALDTQVKGNGAAAVVKIVGRVLSVNPKLHPNLRKVEA